MDMMYRFPPSKVHPFINCLVSKIFPHTKFKEDMQVNQQLWHVVARHARAMPPMDMQAGGTKEGEKDEDKDIKEEDKKGEGTNTHEENLEQIRGTHGPIHLGLVVV